MARKRKAKKNPCGCAARSNPEPEELPIEPVQVTPGVPAEPSCVNWMKLEIVPSEYEACMAPLRKLGKIEGAKQIYEALRGWYAKQDQEVGVVVLLDVQLNVRGAAEVSRGDRSSTIVPIPDILRVALVDGADGIVFCHNHPTGHSTPSDDDKTSTVALDEACEAVGLFLMDHVIVGRQEYFSFADAGLLTADLVMPAEPEEPQSLPWVEPEAAENPRAYAVGDRVILPAGTSVGMGKLRADTPARIEQLQTASDGSTFYGVSWTDSKGKRRTKWWAPPATENPQVEDRTSGARRGWEHRRERDEAVVTNLDPSLVPLWSRMKGSFRGTPHERYEQFLEYVEEHPSEGVEHLQDDVDARLEAELRRQGFAAENPVVSGVSPAVLEAVLSVAGWPGHTDLSCYSEALIGGYLAVRRGVHGTDSYVLTEKGADVLRRFRLASRARENPRRPVHPEMRPIERGLRGMAQRMVQAEENFINTLMRMGDISKPEAEKVYLTYKKLNVIKTDAVNGVIQVKHGGYLDRDVIRRALEQYP